MDEARERFTAIYEACRTRVWAYAASRGGRQLADEVVSDTFAVAWRRFADIPEPPLPWLLGVARNVLRDNFRAEVRNRSLSEELQSWSRAAVDDIAEDVADRHAVLRAMAELPEADRELLILLAWQGLSHRDAARVIGCPAATIRVRLHRARKRFLRALEKQEQSAARPQVTIRMSEELS